MPFGLASTLPDVIPPAGHYTDGVPVPCPHCQQMLSDEFLIEHGTAASGRANQERRREQGKQVGRTPVQVSCPYCRDRFSVRGLRAHLPECTKRPARRTEAQRLREAKLTGRAPQQEPRPAKRK